MVDRRDYIHNANRKQPQGELGPPPEPNGRMVATKPQMSYLSARIVQSNGRTWWRCPECGRTMGEVTRGTVIVKAGDRVLVLSIGNGVSQRCPNLSCGAWSTIVEDRAA